MQRSVLVHLVALVIFWPMAGHAQTQQWQRRLDGNRDDVVKAVSRDQQGNVYLAGHTFSSDFPVSLDAFQKKFYPGKNNSAVFITKLDPKQGEMVFSTLLDGNEQDRLQAMTVDDQGYIYLTGYTYSDNFPAATGKGLYSAKLSPDAGRIIYAHTLAPVGASSHSIMVTPQGEAIIAGSTLVPITLQQAFDTERGPPKRREGFVMKLNENGNLLFSTYLGGNHEDVINSIAADQEGNIYVGGITESEDFPTVNAMQDKLGGRQDMFLGKLHKNGNRLLFATYLGGEGLDHLADIAVDNQGRVFLTGHSDRDFPLVQSLYPDSHANGIDAVVAVVDPSGRSLQFSSYLGGSKTDLGQRIQLTSEGNVWVGGLTYSINYPKLSPLQSDLGGKSDIFVTRLAAPNYGITFSSYIGGQEEESIGDLLWRDGGEIVVAGASASDRFHFETDPQDTEGMAAFAMQIDSNGQGADVEAMFANPLEITEAQSYARNVELLIANNGGNNATVVQLQLSLPKDSKIVSQSTPGFTCFDSEGDYLCVTNSVPAGEQRRLRFDIELATLDTGSLSLQASAKERDPNTGNNHDQIKLQAQKTKSAKTAEIAPGRAPSSEQRLFQQDYFCYCFP